MQKKSLTGIVDDGPYIGGKGEFKRETKIKNEQVTRSARLMCTGRGKTSSERAGQKI